MAIVKMKKLRVMALAECREDLLGGLQHLGCVEISEPNLSDPAWSALLRRGSSSLAQTRTEIADAHTALAAIKQYAKVKDGLFIQRRQVSEQEFLDPTGKEQAKAVSQKIGGALREISRLQGDEARLTARRQALTPWASLDMPLELEGTAHARFRLMVCPSGTDIGAVRIALADVAAELYEVSADKQQTYVLLLCHRAEEETAQELLRPFNFSAVAFPGTTGTAAENMDALDQSLADNKKAQEAAAAAIVQDAKSRDVLRMYLDQLRAEAEKDASAERLLTTVQIADAGVAPGSGVGNHRAALTREELGVPVVALGIPTVIHASTILRDALEHIAGEAGARVDARGLAEDLGAGDLLVTPAGIDEQVRAASALLADAIDLALHAPLTLADIRAIRGE